MGRKFNVRKEAMQKTMIKKSKVYSKYGKELYVCAKKGGTNPEANLELKHLIQRAKNDDVPVDVINRNIKKAEEGTGEDYEPIRYEGFGPGGTGIIVDTLTDNVNRTVAEVRACFTKADCKLGVNGSVEHAYNHLSYISVKGLDAETVLETLLMEDIDINDIEDSDGVIEVEADGYDLSRVQKALEDAGAEVVDSEKGWYPMDYIALQEADQETFDRLIDALNDLEDVQDVYHNAK
ncbi:MAG: YebC/PmpR family DNA-binding transcriptional regulator [Candidatus Izemoplasma sp.]|nr:YebC/PmpR family DNA-binding transcriptional regulator [Candidatus Izemoplasma sp.]